MLEDPFLKALAEGGHQVGALAQAYFPNGVLIDTLDKEVALRQTSELLQQEEVVIFEAAFRHENLFIRADIVRKKGQFLDLIEVKAKSYDPREEFSIWHKGQLKKDKYVLSGEFTSYLVDLAFQTHVVAKSCSHLTIRSFLMLADKSKTASVEGLNQRFKITRGPNGRVAVRSKDKLTAAELGEAILTRKELTDEIKILFNQVQFSFGPTFAELVNKLAQLAATEQPGEAAHGSQCKSCPFRVEAKEDVKSGFDQCWTEKGVKHSDLNNRPFIFEVWDFRSSDKMIEEGIYFADQLSVEDIKLKSREDSFSGLSRTERQHLQIEFAQGLNRNAYFDAEGLKAELSTLKYPLHFIDFETNMLAIPFHKGLQPYEQVAFQFSHHILHEDGRIEHKTEYLDDRVGVFPNFDFVRALKKALGADDGAVLRFAAHENTVLNQIRDQLLYSSEPDIEELVEWIQTLTTPPRSRAGEWTPTRQFIDMCELTKRFFWLPEMKGSNSIKKVLPAVLNAAGPRLKLRFPEWIKLDSSGRVMDPYKLLPPIFSDLDVDEMAKVEEWFVEAEMLNDGGGAMMAWARMQFTEMSDLERSALCTALKRYCGLDTLAMVMIWEWWIAEISKTNRRSAASDSK